MNESSITLPPLPNMSTGALKAAFEEYARAAVELDRQGRGEPVAANEAYDKVDRFLRNNLGDDDYAEYSEALDAACSPKPAEPVKVPSEGDHLRWALRECGVSRSDSGAFFGELALGKLAALLARYGQPAQAADAATIAGLEATIGHLSRLVDEQRRLLVEVEDVCGRDGHGGQLEDGESELIDRIRQHLAGTVAAQQSMPDRRRLRELVDVVWNEATESTAVPDTPWADSLIDKVFEAAPTPPADGQGPHV